MTTFQDVAVQNTRRSPLAAGEETSLGLNQLLSVASGKDGNTIWHNFKKKTVKKEGWFAMPNGVVFRDTFLVGSTKPKLAVLLSHAPMCLAVVLEKVLARNVLCAEELQLHATLVLRGMTPEAATAAISESSPRLPAKRAR